MTCHRDIAVTVSGAVLQTATATNDDQQRAGGGGGGGNGGQRGLGGVKVWGGDAPGGVYRLLRLNSNEYATKLDTKGRYDRLGLSMLRRT